ncbi:MAG: stringent starvation protein A, partial [Gammaproteobacteria bacterium]
MGVVANRRSIMSLFSAPDCPLSHCARLVLAEKGITFDVINVDNEEAMSSLADLNPYGDIPTLVDRDLVLYDVRIISEYLDERFPHPPLMPVDPVSRASSRLGLHRVFTDWYSLLPDVESEDKKISTKAKKELRDSIAASADIFSLKPFFLSDD